MALPAINCLELFSGVGMLGEGLRLAVPRARVVCHVEREAYAAATLVARMEDEAMERAPVWDDVTTFDGRPWRGLVDLIAGGFPCQDISQAGRREGIQEGNRSGLWFEFARIIGEVRPRYVLLENVAAIALPGRGLDRVLGSLSELGFDAEWLTLGADEVGASHQRDRWFLLAHSRGIGRRGRDHGDSPGGEGALQAKGRRIELAHPARDGRPRGSARQRVERSGGEGGVADAEGAGLGELRGAQGPELQPGGQFDGRLEAMANAPDDHGRRGVGGTEEGARTGEGGWPGLAGGSGEVADAGEPRSQGRLLGRGDHAEGREVQDGRPAASHEPVGDPVRERRQREDDGELSPGGAGEADLPVLPPGPSAPEWGRIVGAAPWLAPAVEPGVRVLAHGLALVVDQGRADQLRCAGNGVVALQAAVAVAELARRLGVHEEIGVIHAP